MTPNRLSRACALGAAVVALFLFATASGAGAIYAGGVTTNTQNGDTQNGLTTRSGDPGEATGGPVNPNSATPTGAVVPTNIPDEALGETLTRSAPGGGATTAAPAGGGQQLPLTGGDVAGLAAIGLAAILAGMIVLTRSRRIGTRTA